MKEIISILILISLVALFMVNTIVMKKMDKRNENMLQYINTKKMLIRSDSKQWRQNEAYKNKDFFKMNNKGTKLCEDPGEIIF